MNQLRQNGDDVYGLISSHPAACLAAAKAFGSRGYILLCVDANSLIDGIGTVAVSFIRDNAKAFINMSPISYIKNAKLQGSLFDVKDTSGLVSSVYTDFFVDHTELLEALNWVQEELV